MFLKFSLYAKILLIEIYKYATISSSIRRFTRDIPTQKLNKNYNINIRIIYFILF